MEELPCSPKEKALTDRGSTPLADRPAQARGIQRGAGGEAAFPRQIQMFAHIIRDNIRRIRNRNHNPLIVERLHVADHILQHGDGIIQHLQPRLTGFSRHPDADNHQIRIRHILITAHPDNRSRPHKTHAVCNIQRIAQNLILVNIQQYHFVRGALNGQRPGNVGTDMPGTDNDDFSIFQHCGVSRLSVNCFAKLVILIL